MQTLAKHATESSTYVVDIDFFDEDGAPVVPDSASWTLSTLIGEIINNKQDVSIVALAESVTIVLLGDDLPYTGDQESIELTIESTYTSSLGSGLPCNKACRIVIDGLRAV